MATIRRRAADVLERVIGARVVRPRDLPILYEQEFLTRFLREFEVDMVFDVGANGGQYARMLRTKAAYEGDIVSFEPIPYLAQQLREQAEHDDRWHVEEMALGQEPGRSTFNIMLRDEFSSLLSPVVDQVQSVAHKNQVASQISVRVGTVAESFEKYRATHDLRRPFLKMDTQGNDLNVVRGAGRALELFVGLQSELAIRQLYSGAVRFTEAIEAYESLGFVLSAIFPNNTGNFPDVLEMDCVMYRRGCLTAET